MVSASTLRWGLVWVSGLALLFLIGLNERWKNGLLSFLGFGGSPWNVFYHLGGNGPWIKKVDGVVDSRIEAPVGCRVEQVHMLSRHAERYPTSNAGARMLALLQRIEDSNITFKGQLDFVNDWPYFSLDPSAEHDQLTSTGPYAGTLSAFGAGTRLRTRYRNLLSTSSVLHPINFWASDSNRVIETARYFATGFFGPDWDCRRAAKLHIIPETPDLGADTLTPGDTCLKYREDLLTGHDYGLIQLSKFRSAYLPPVSARFQAQNPGIKFTDGEIYSMQEMCGFETLVRGSSPWCNVFTHGDWLNFEYARDIIHYHRAGPGNKYGAVMGWLWLNATSNLLAEGPDAGGLFFSFVHDGDIVPMLAALDLFPSTTQLPVTHRLKDRAWKMLQVVPMNGRVIFERLICEASVKDRWSEPSKRPQHYVRINVNDGIVALPTCSSGPGSSCPLEDFLSMVRRRGEEVGDFHEICGLVGEDSPGGITFLHQ